MHPITCEHEHLFCYSVYSNSNVLCSMRVLKKHAGLDIILFIDMSFKQAMKKGVVFDARNHFTK